MRKPEDKDFTAALIMAVSALIVVASVVLAITNKLRQRRLMRRLSQCVDTVQQAMPAVERASRLYIRENSARHEDEEDLAF